MAAAWACRINAHSIVACWTETPLASPTLHDETFERNVMKRMPQRRWSEPSDFARLAVYLAAGIGGFHTGDEIVVDGAYSIFGPDLVTRSVDPIGWPVGFPPGRPQPAGSGTIPPGGPNRSRSAFLRTLPLGLRGSASTTRRCRGRL